MNCTTCNNEMKPLFSSFFCPNDCDKKTKYGDFQESELKIDTFYFVSPHSLAFPSRISNGLITIEPKRRMDFWFIKHGTHNIKWRIVSPLDCDYKLEPIRGVPDACYIVNDGNTDIVLEPLLP